MRLVIIIVNYCAADLVCECLQSLENEIEGKLERVIVVDNNSSDDSLSRLLQKIDDQSWSWVSVLKLDRNGGFAVGNNAGFQKVLGDGSTPEYFMLLNPDTIVQKGAIGQLLSFLDNHPSVGVVGAQVINGKRELDSSARRFPSFLSELESGARLGVLSKMLKKKCVAMPISRHAHQCEWVSGAAMMIRRQVVEQIGMLDEQYFLYFEELDYCKMVNDAGWETWFEPHSRVIHFEGSVTEVNNVRKRRKKYWYDSRRRYFIKHHGVFGWVVIDLFWAFGRCSLLLRKSIGLGGDTSADPMKFMTDLLLGDIKFLFKGDAFKQK